MWGKGGTTDKLLTSEGGVGTDRTKSRRKTMGDLIVLIESISSIHKKVKVHVCRDVHSR